MTTLNFTEKYINLSTFDIFVNEPDLKTHHDIIKPIGEEHYIFLASLGIQLTNKTIIELGTHKGISAYLLSYGNRYHNTNNKIITYDIIQFDMPFVDNTNIIYELKNLFDPEIREINSDILLQSDVIFIDIDPHEGILEYDIYIWLKNNNFKGIIIYDDIKLGRGHMGSMANSSMSEFWDKIPSNEKIDISHIGHWSGTGIVSFDFKTNNILL